jgi:penicillin-binding protein 1A
MIWQKVLHNIAIKYNKFAQKSTKAKIKSIGIIFLSLGALCLLLLLGFYFCVVGGLFGKIPNDIDLQNLKNYQASEIYSSDGIILGRYFVENRSEAKFEEIPKELINALVATEDSRFYLHTGVDSRSLMRVLFKSIILRQGKGGGSTLSQQLAKNIYGRKKYGFLTMPVNKVREAIIANKLEKLYTKNEILLLYLNTVSFGEETYGIKTGSQRFFGKDPQYLKLEESAVLIGMLKAPFLYNPHKKPLRSTQRRNVVLYQMLQNKFITEKKYKELIKKDIVLNYKKIDNINGSTAYIREKLRLELEEWIKDKKKPDGSEYNLYTDGLKILTSIHSKTQKYAEQACMEQLRAMQPLLHKDLRANGFYKKNQKLIGQEIKNSYRYQQLKNKGYEHADIINELVKKDSIYMYSHWGSKERYMSPMDSIYESLITLKMAFMAVNPKNGDVLAWVGGPDYKTFQYDHVTAKRQVGSIFKPIVYLEALQNGRQACDFVPNQKVTYTQYDNWSPENADHNYEGKYSLKGALANSVNTITVKLAMETGVEKVINLAEKLGIESEMPKQPSLALGSADISLYEMMKVYACFANDGTKTDFNIIKSITDVKGKVLFKSKTELEKVIDIEISHSLTNMLKSVVENGTANNLRSVYNLNGDIAGKTGTTQDQRDAWFIGYNSKIVAGVWVGADKPQVHFSDLNSGQGAILAMPIWAKFYQKLSASALGLNYTNQEFPFEDDQDCELYSNGNLIDRLFRKSEIESDEIGIKKDSLKTKKKRKWLKLFQKK